MIEGGASAIFSMAKYSWWHGCFQVVLLLGGAFLLPLGTLMVTTAEYTAQTNQRALVGMPLPETLPVIHPAVLFLDMSIYEGQPSYDFNFTNGIGDYFMSMAIAMFKGNMVLVQQAGLISTTPKTLGPTATANITYESGVQYNGIGTFDWDANCTFADEIKYTATEPREDDWLVSFTFPDGTKTSDDVWSPVVHVE